MTIASAHRPDVLERAFLTVCRISFLVAIAYVTFGTLTPHTDEIVGASIADRIAAFLFGDATYGDKVGHFVAYATLSGLLVLARFLPGRTLASIAALSLYGIGLEFVQGAMGYRQLDYLDGVANTAGTIAAYPVALAASGLIARLAGWTSRPRSVD